MSGAGASLIFISEGRLIHMFPEPGGSADNLAVAVDV